jgi:uncharacterized protein
VLRIWRLPIQVIFALGAIFVVLLGSVNVMDARSEARPNSDALLEAVLVNSLDLARRALDADVPVDSRDARGRTALLLATRDNAADVAKLLIASGADVNAKDDIEDSPFLYAGAEGRLEILKLTVAAGADLGSLNRYGGTALIPAAHHGHVETVRYLLTTSIDVDHVNDLGWTALMEAVILGDGGPVYQKIVDLLLAAGADARIADHDGVTPLRHARSRGQNGIVESLLRASR